MCINMCIMYIHETLIYRPHQLTAGQKLSNPNPFEDDIVEQRSYTEPTRGMFVCVECSVHTGRENHLQDNTYT